MALIEAFFRLSISNLSTKTGKEAEVETFALEPVIPRPRPVRHNPRKPSMCQRNLPRNILGDIFKKACIVPWTFTSDADGGNALPPVALSQVCSAWRRVALTTAEIWSYIQVSVPLHPSLNPFLLQEWSKRVGSGPHAGLHLVISKGKSRPHRQSNYGQSPQILLPLFHCCRSIELDLPSRASLTTLILSYLRHRPQLNPTVILGPGTGRETRKFHALLLDSAPASLTIKNYLPGSCQWQWNLFRTDSGLTTNNLLALSKNGLWTHITHADLYDPIDLSTLQNLLHAMNRCTQLQSLHVWSLRNARSVATGKIQTEDDPTAQSFYKFDNLHSLTLSGSTHLRQLLSRLILPSIRQLELSYGGSEKILTAEANAFASLLTRSQQYRIHPNYHLRTLTLTFRTGIVSESTLSDFLTPTHLSNLSTLDLTADISEKIIDLLSARRGLRSIFMPNLLDMRLGLCVIRDKRLSSMVSFRRNAPGPGCLPLQRIDIVPENPGKVDQLEFEKLFRQGLEGRFQSSNRRRE